MRTVLIMASLAAVAAPVMAQRAPTTSDPVLRAREDRIRDAFMIMPDTPGTGPFKAIKEVDPTLPAHVVYRPANLAGMKGRKLGVIVWGNGGCRDDGASARQELAELASHGYVAIAPGTIQNGPGVTPPPVASEVPGGGTQTTTAQVLAGLDWALAENARKGSRYYHRIDPRLTGVSGTSCGGLQAIQAAATDARLHAVVAHNTGLFTTGINPINGFTVSKETLERLRTPIVYISGGPSDISYANAADDFARIADVPVVWTSINVGHGGTLREANGGAAAQVALHWFEWQLRGDKASARWFTGADCVLCKDPAWSIRRKGL